MACQFAIGAHVKVIDPSHPKFGTEGIVQGSYEQSPGSCVYKVLPDGGQPYEVFGATDAQLELA